MAAKRACVERYCQHGLCGRPSEKIGMSNVIELPEIKVVSKSSVLETKISEPTQLSYFHGNWFNPSFAGQLYPNAMRPGSCHNQRI